VDTNVDTKEICTDSKGSRLEGSALTN
jgi:hypothetical protein